MQRLAAMLRNSRRMAAACADLCGGLDFAHRLYIALAPERPKAEQGSQGFGRRDVPRRERAQASHPHAGSFGFDFAAAEWFRDTVRERHLVRIAVPDLPTALWDRTVGEIVRWWKQNVGRATPLQQVDARRPRLRADATA